jgi:hypothetical protein
MSLNCPTSRMHSQPPARGDRLRGVVALYQPSIFKHRRKRSAAAIGERIGPALTIVRDESPNRHGLHRMGGDADRAMGNAGRHAEQNHAVLCAELCRRLSHDGRFPWSGPSQRRHRSLAAPTIPCRRFLCACSRRPLSVVLTCEAAMGLERLTGGRRIDFFPSAPRRIRFAETVHCFSDEDRRSVHASVNE